MSGARLTKGERFQTLLEHILIPEEIKKTYFEDGYIDKLLLYRNRKKWVFHFVLNRVPPSHIYELFMDRLRSTYAHIAEIEARFRFEEEVDPETLVRDYWGQFLKEYAGQLGAFKHTLEKPLHFSRGVFTFPLLHEVEITLFQKNIEPLIRSFYQRFADFPVYFRYELVDEPDTYQRFLDAKEKEEQAKVEEALREREQKETVSANEGAISIHLGYEIKDEPVSLCDIREEERQVCVEGQIFYTELKELKSGRTLLTFYITDYTDSIAVKVFSRDKEDALMFEKIKKGMWVKVRGRVETDTFLRDLVLLASDINQLEPRVREDVAEEKRVELHLHTNMSAMDGVTPISTYVEQAAKWGHPAIAVTDHAVAQSFPEAYQAGKKHGVKIIYGIEGYLVDDGVPIVYQPERRLLKEETYVVFDIETTGLSAAYHTIIELAAVKVANGEIVDRFESFVNPHEPISAQISELTGITDDMVRDAPDLEVVLKDFYQFIGNHTLVAHNASFDMGFLQMGYKRLGMEINNPVLDTLELARFLYPSLKNHRLNTLCKQFNIPLLNHHRAVEDAAATGQLLVKMLADTLDKGITYLDELNQLKGEDDYKRARPNHCIILAQNQAGLKNLYKLISLAHIDYFHRVPRIPRSVLTKYRDGLIIGSGCSEGEVFTAVMQKSPEEVEQVASFYDYLEIQPVANYEHLLERELVKGRDHIKELLTKIVQLGKKLNKPVVATGNVHYLNKEDAIYRKILMTTLGGAAPIKPDLLPPVHFRTTDEMLKEFQFLGEEEAFEVVVKNTRLIAEQIEEIRPIPDALYTPKIEGAEEAIREMSYAKAKSIYGDPLPEIVEKRLEKELASIIGHGFAVIYLISHKLVKKSLEDGYLVGSRGSVGSSFVATMTEITEVNPLPPHYVCLNCHYSQFFDDGTVGSGFDLPDKDCPQCGEPLLKDGHDIPFETFLGFKGDKVPDIDLNFSGEYQPIAHKYTQELFGPDNVFRAGTIGTVAEKTAFGFVKKYEEEEGLSLRQAEIMRLASGCTGVKRTTGQHPGGIIVVPSDREIYEFTPIQYPADDPSSEWRTTHFDFHSIHDNLLKLDILGHDDPTVIRMLQDLSGIDPKKIPIGDPKVMQIFSGTEALGVTSEQIMSNVGSLGIPEFGTRFVRQMLEETKPTTFAELVQISGLSHGTDVWLNNAQEIIKKGIAPLSEVISTRDDIMVYLIHKGLEPSRAFNIMERVRKGKGLTEEDISYMKEYDVPDWYIESCQKIKYMFPKAHAVAYVLMAVRIAYFKVYYPIYFYAAYFTVRADDFDINIAIRGSQAVRKRLEEILAKGNEASPKERSLLTVLEVCLEMLERGFKFQKVDLYRSHATQFIVDGDTLIPPFCAIPGVGITAAQNIMKAREEGEFLSKEDLQTRSRITKTVLEFLEAQGCLANLPESNQLSLF